MRLAALGAWLVALWLFLWGQASLANVVSGALVAVALLIVFPVRGARSSHLPFRPWALLRLALHYAYELVTSTVLVGRAAVAPRSRVRTGIVACPLEVRSNSALTVLVNLLTLSPGSMPIEVKDNPPTLYVHVLLLHDPEGIRSEVAKLERLVIEALGSSEQAAKTEPPPPTDPTAVTAGGLDE